MSLAKKIIYTLLVTAVFFAILSYSVVGLSYTVFFLVCAALGVFIAYTCREVEPYESWEWASIVYLPLASSTIIIGMINNSAHLLITQIIGRLQSAATPNQVTEAVFHVQENMMSGLAQFVSPRMIPLELILLTIGIFGPVMVHQYYTKKRIPWISLLSSVFIIVAIYALALLIQQIIMMQVISV